MRDDAFTKLIDNGDGILYKSDCVYEASLAKAVFVTYVGGVQDYEAKISQLTPQVMCSVLRTMYVYLRYPVVLDLASWHAAQMYRFILGAFEAVMIREGFIEMWREAETDVAIWCSCHDSYDTNVVVPSNSL